MTRKALLERMAEGLPTMRKYYNEAGDYTPNPAGGDTLAAYIVDNVTSSLGDPAYGGLCAGGDVQIALVCGILEQSIQDLSRVYNALQWAKENGDA